MSCFNSVGRFSAVPHWPVLSVPQGHRPLTERVNCRSQFWIVAEIPMRVTAKLYAIYTRGNLNNLKPLFRLPSIEPDGATPVNEEFSRSVMPAAVDWLKRIGTSAT
jgi:hypothetical protein